MFQGVGIGDHAYVDQATGAYVKMDMIPTTTTVSVLSRIPMEAEQLAWFIAEHMWLLRLELMKGNNFIMYMGQRPQIGPPSPAGSLVGGPDTESDWIVVQVSMPVHLQHMAVAMPLNKKIISGIGSSVPIPKP